VGERPHGNVDRQEHDGDEKRQHDDELEHRLAAIPQGVSRLDVFVD
jgi:hypothetical protein